jgi:hypothetical protein
MEKEYNLDADTESETDAVDVAALLDANMKLLTFLTQQSETIARLRNRIVKLKTLIYDLSYRSSTSSPDNLRSPTPTQGTTAPPPDGAGTTPPTVKTYYGIRRGHLTGVCESWEALQSRITGYSCPVFQPFSTWEAAKAYVIEGMWQDMPDSARPYATPPFSFREASGNDKATVLVDTDDPCSLDTDASFLVKPHIVSPVDLTCLDHNKIQSQLATQLAKIHAKRNKEDELWMYFDSGASRSVISTTSPVRQHLQAVEPAYGSCSIGDGRPLNYHEKGHIRSLLFR